MLDPNNVVLKRRWMFNKTMSTIQINCSRCNKNLSPDNFKKRKTGEYYKQCLECNKIISANKLKKSTEKKNTDDGFNTLTHNKCHVCSKVLENDKFNKTKNGITKNCSECLLKRKNQENMRKTKETNDGEKICIRCNVSKLLSEFSTNKDGYNKQCIDCCKKYSTLQKKKKDAKKETLKDEINSSTMVCNKCFIVKDKKYFKLRKTGEYNKQCIDCNSKQLDYLEINKCSHGYLNKSCCRECNGSSYCVHNKVRTYCADCNGGSLCEHNTRKDRCKLCRSGNQFCEHDKLRTLCLVCDGGSFCEHKTRRTRCIECNFSGFLKDKVSSRIQKALKNKKSLCSIEYLGCDIGSFKKHLENKFVEGMNWENYGSIWHIDHIIPIAYKKPSLDEVIKRLHYSNTQPLWALENISKGNRYIG